MEIALANELVEQGPRSTEATPPPPPPPPPPPSAPLKKHAASLACLEPELERLVCRFVPPPSIAAVRARLLAEKIDVEALTIAMSDASDSAKMMALLGLKMGPWVKLERYLKAERRVQESS